LKTRSPGLKSGATQWIGATDYLSTGCMCAFGAGVGDPQVIDTRGGCPESWTGRFFI
jgi:hypothetical protein